MRATDKQGRNPFTYGRTTARKPAQGPVPGSPCFHLCPGLVAQKLTIVVGGKDPAVRELTPLRLRTLLGTCDFSVAAAHFGKILSDPRKARTRLAAEQRQKALATTEKLLTDTWALIGIIARDAKHIGELGQIASMNLFV